MKSLTSIPLILLIFILSGKIMYGQNVHLSKVSAGFPVNYNEDSVGTYTLPDLLTMQNGEKVKDTKTWLQKRRPELLSLIESQQYGKVPPAPEHITFNVLEKNTRVFNGKGIRRQIVIYLTPDTLHKVNVLFYLPAKARKPVPQFLNISFSTNAAAANDSDINSGYIWTKDGRRVPAHRLKNPDIPIIDKLLEAGIGVATLYYGDIEPDFKKGFNYGIRKYYLKNNSPAADEWGAIAAWSWGLSRVMDYLETDKQIDARRVALFGVSRLGKTVLWTGARDSRFKLVIASCSGEGGAALSRRDYGENLKHLTDTSRYFYQFSANYHTYANDVNRLPFDAHAIIALMAPRPLLLQTGDADYWSDPKGEFLSALAAGPVYGLFGEKGPEIDLMPKAGDTHLLLNPLGYYMHSGGHGTIKDDWNKYLLFLKKFL